MSLNIRTEQYSRQGISLTIWTVYALKNETLFLLEVCQQLCDLVSSAYKKYVAQVKNLSFFYLLFLSDDLPLSKKRSHLRGLFSFTEDDFFYSSVYIKNAKLVSIFYYQV